MGSYVRRERSRDADNPISTGRRWRDGSHFVLAWIDFGIKDEQEADYLWFMVLIWIYGFRPGP